jgi:mono/diheme cytochrome c family protein
MARAFPVIARRAKHAEAISATGGVAGDCFAALAMTVSLCFFLFPSPARAAEGDVDQGRDTYGELCVTCHGRDMVNAGALSFDLRKFPKNDFERFKTSVLNGKGRAMPAWRDKVSDEDVANLWAYVRSGG